MKVRGRIRREVSTTSPEVSVGVALQLAECGGMREMPVVRGGRLVGIVDRKSLEEAEGGCVGDIMSSEPLPWISPEADLRRAAAILWSHDLESLPVLEDGALLGIITRVDIARGLMSAGQAAFNTDEQESPPLRRGRA